jgi:hypothetical protein
MVRRALLPCLCAGVLWPADAAARTDERGRPFARGTFQPSLGLGASFGGPLAVMHLGLGARYFVVHGLGPGLEVSDTILVYGPQTRAQFPGIERQLPTNIVRILPSLQWVFVRTRWFSPYVLGGAGPVFYNHGGGTVGEWMAGGGAFIGLGGPVFVDLGVGFSGVFPRETCRAAFTYQSEAGGAELDACSFSWGPRLGLALAFGVGGDSGRRRKTRAPPPPPERGWEAPVPEPPPPASEPSPEPPPAPELEEPPAGAPETAPAGEEPAPPIPDAAPAPDLVAPEIDEPAPPPSDANTPDR